MNVAFFGGTFDPIHRGHLAIARAARKRFHLDRIYFVPADVPPHKQRQPVTPFEHRYAMVALATAAEKGFIPSLLEAPPRHSNVLAFRGRSEAAPPVPNYSIHTLRRLKQELPRKTRLFFLVGVDTFLDIAKWRQPEELLEEAEFIVAARPGYSLAEVAAALPASRRPPPGMLKTFARQTLPGSLVLPGVTLHLLGAVKENVSATQIRAAVQGKRSLARYVAPEVAEYITKLHLYQGAGLAVEAKRTRRARRQRRG